MVLHFRVLTAARIVVVRCAEAPCEQGREDIPLDEVSTVPGVPGPFEKKKSKGLIFT